MPDFVKYTLFFVTAPFMFVLLYIIYNFYGEDSSGKGWYQDLWEGNIFQRFLALLLWPVFIPLTWFVETVYESWEGLSE